MMSNVSDDYDKSNGSFIYDSTKPGAVVFSEVQKDIINVQEKIDIYNLSGDELERFVYQRTALARKKETKAITTVVISGRVGVSVKVGDLVGTDTLNFIIKDNQTIGEEGFINATVECESYGSVGNVPANAITIFPVSISGLVDVYNPLAVANGYDAESDIELIARYFEKLQKPGKAGNVYHYLEWAKSVTGVGDAKVTPRWNGPLTVKVTIIDSNKKPADSKLIKEAADFIESEMPFGANLTVEGAVGIPINIKVELTLVQDYLKEDVIINIENNITNYLKSISFQSSFVSYAKIGSAIIDSEGVLDYQNLLINNSSSNVQVNDNQVAILGGVTA